MDSAAGKIRELIGVLDARKDEAIERTFKGVAKHFREVFGELVPGGSRDDRGVDRIVWPTDDVEGRRAVGSILVLLQSCNPPCGAPQGGEASW